MRVRSIPGLVLAMLAASCTVGPNYRRPAVEVPAAYKSAGPAEPAAKSVPSDWWTIFGDDDLTTYEVAAVTGNQDLAAAMDRVLQARAAAGVARSAFYPSVTLDSSVARTKSPARSLTGNAIASTLTTSQIAFDLSYEFDVWGRVRRSYESAQAMARASEDDFGVILLTLTADVAQDYFTIVTLDAQDEILLRSLDLFRQQVELTKTQAKSGIVGEVDVVQAQTLADVAEALEIDVRRQRADAEHALVILLGRPPSALGVKARKAPPQVPVVPAGLPADLLRRRPDVAEAEHDLIAANASVGVAIANFYPAFRLTGLAGFESLDPGKVLDWENRVWSLGPGLSAPVFEGGRLTSELLEARARWAELVAVFRQRVLVAFREVEDALTDLHMRAQMAEAQDRAVASSREYVRLSDLRYRKGLLGYFQVIDAERSLLTNELSAVQTLNQRLISTVLLIKALGCGWAPDLPECRSTTRSVPESANTSRPDSRP